MTFGTLFLSISVFASKRLAFLGLLRVHQCCAQPLAALLMPFSTCDLLRAYSRVTYVAERPQPFCVGSPTGLAPASHTGMPHL